MAVILVIILLDFSREVMQNENVNCQIEAEQKGAEVLSPKEMSIPEAQSGKVQPAVFQEIIP